MQTVSPQQIDEQVKLERQAINIGLKRLTDQTLKLEDQSYASASIYAVASIDTLLPLVRDKIEETKLKIHKGSFGVTFKEIHQYLNNVESLAAAAIACKLTFDKVFGYKDKCNLAVNVCESIGRAIEDECQMRHYELCAPGLLNTLKENYWHKAIGTNQKLVVIKTLMNRYDVKRWESWQRSVRIKLGAWLLDCIMESSNWFFRQRIKEGRKTVVYVVPTPEFMDIKDEVMANAELFSPLAWPMYIPPNDWSNEKPGGYLLNEVMRGHQLVRRSGSARIQGETPISFLNTIQKVGYTLNPFTVKVAETLQDRGISVGKFLPIIHYDLPPKPPDIADNKDARKAYRRSAAEVMNKQAAVFKKSCRTRMTMEAIQRFKDRERFYIPWSFDYRGRAYPIPAFLTPQDTDFGKACIRFADESYLKGDAVKWLAFQCATTYGLDKATMAERLSWTNENIPLITRVANDPIDNIGDWEAAEEPWQFLAACDEYYHCVLNKDRVTTGLPVATDATCSGLQILAGLARDRKSAQLVNVLPSERPQDAYKVIAEDTKPHIPRRLQPYMDRKVTKRTVMTIPYNAKPFSNATYVRDALLNKGFKYVGDKSKLDVNHANLKKALNDSGLVIDRDELTILVRRLRESMHRIVPGPMSVMKWIESEISSAILNGPYKIVKNESRPYKDEEGNFVLDDEGKKTYYSRVCYLHKGFEWITPSGFVVSQHIMKKKVERITLQLLGRCDISVATEAKNESDLNRHKAATAPNLIHSLDASLLHLSVTRFEHPIALIHDSVLCRAVDMAELSAIIREIYMHLFAEHDYLTEFAHQIGATTEPPIIGDLKPESVIDSTYFFC